MSDKHRIMFDGGSIDGWTEIPSMSMLHPEARELWMDYGEVPEDVWQRYQRALRELGEAHIAVGESLRPIELSTEEAQDVEAAWIVEKLEEARLDEKMRRDIEELRATCDHRDGYGPLFMDGNCMVCGASQEGLTVCPRCGRSDLTPEGLPVHVQSCMSQLGGEGEQ